jgi:hypothetical protein
VLEITESMVLDPSLKLDRTLIDSMSTESGTAVVRAAVDLGDSLGAHRDRARASRVR